jgi:hypothetical protein
VCPALGVFPANVINATGWDIRHVPGDKALYVRDRRTAGWLEGTPFWVLVMGVLLVI